MSDLLGPSGLSSRIRRVEPLLWPAVLIVFLVLGVLGLSHGPDITSGDYAHYLLHARALAEGRPYTDIGYIYTAQAWVIGPPAQPPGLPLILAPILALTHENMLVIRMVMLAFAAVFVMVSGRYFAVHEDRLSGVAVSLILAVSASIVSASSQVLSDLPFAAVVWCLVVLYDRDGPWNVSRLVFVTLLGAGAMAFRTAGLVVVPAGFLFLILRYREHRWRPAVPLLAWGALLLVGAGITGAASGLRDRLSLNILGLPAQALERLLSYRFEMAEGLLYPFPSDPANDIYHALAVLVVAIGLTEWLRRSWRSYAAVFAASYCAMLVVVSVFAGRYLWPLLPLLVFGLLNGGRTLMRWTYPRWAPARRSFAVFGVAGVLAVSSLVFRNDEDETGSLVEQASVQQLFDYLRSNAAGEELRVAFVKPRVLTLETRIPAMGTFAAGPDTVLAVLRRQRITHVVLGGFGLAPDADRAFRATVESRSDEFRLEYQNGEFTVYRFDGDTTTTAEERSRPRS